jgi:hypothetical protein
MITIEGLLGAGKLFACKCYMITIEGSLRVVKFVCVNVT